MLRMVCLCPVPGVTELCCPQMGLRRQVGGCRSPQECLESPLYTSILRAGLFQRLHSAFPHVNSVPCCNPSMGSFSKIWLRWWLCFLKGWTVLISPGFELFAQPQSKLVCFSCCSPKVLSGYYLQTRNTTFAVWSPGKILLIFLACGAMPTSLCTAGVFVQ